MKKFFIFLLIIIIAVLLEITVLDYFKILNVKPDIILIITVIAVLYLKSGWGIVLCVFAGIFKDSFSINTFGINTLLLTLWGFLILKLDKKITIDNNLIRAILIFIILILNDIVTRVIFLSLGRFVSFGIFLRITFLESLYTALISPLVFKVLKPIL